MVRINIWVKAVWAALLAFLGGLSAAIGAGGALDASVWLPIVITTLVAFGGVVGLGGVPSKDPDTLKIQAQGLALKSKNAFTVT